MKRALALALTAALIPATVAAPKAKALKLRCHPVHVIQAAGTGLSHSWDPSARETLFDDASSPADDLQRRFGARTMSTYTVKYPASLGRFSARSRTWPRATCCSAPSTRSPACAWRASSSCGLAACPRARRSKNRGFRFSTPP